MRASELNQLSIQALEAKLKDLKTELFNLRFQHTTNQLDNPHVINDVKKDIARVMTVLQQKKSQEEAK
ncbi:MAG: 50S ribosomal protein L29 [Clostridia bacterium]|nr:50S ribosomal protein L29 [Clostridia bacterium]